LAGHGNVGGPNSPPERSGQADRDAYLFDGIDRKTLSHRTIIDALVSDVVIISVACVPVVTSRRIGLIAVPSANTILIEANAYTVTRAIARTVIGFGRPIADDHEGDDQRRQDEQLFCEANHVRVHLKSLTNCATSGTRIHDTAGGLGADAFNAPKTSLSTSGASLPRHNFTTAPWSSTSKIVGVPRTFILSKGV
jgi:hypothetical protein